jgi:hypothetical protein
MTHHPHHVITPPSKADELVAFIEDEFELVTQQTVRTAWNRDEG